jgi:cytoplasmic FMR1 interacting protein
MVPKITALQEALPKSIGLLSFDGGIAGNILVGEIEF